MQLPIWIAACFKKHDVTSEIRSPDEGQDTQNFEQETSSISELGLEVQSTLLPSFERTPEEVFSTLSGIYISADEPKRQYDYPAGFHFGSLTIPFTPLPKAAHWCPKKRFDFFVGSEKLEDEIKEPLKWLCLLKCYPKYTKYVEDRRFVTVERTTGCKFALDDESDPRKILKLLKVRPHQPQKPHARKISIFGNSSQTLAHAIAVLSQEMPSLMSHAVFKSRLLLGFSASNYYPIHGRMIFPQNVGKAKKRAYVSVPGNLIRRENYFHMKKPKKSQFILKGSPQETSSLPKFAPVSEPREAPLSLEDSWGQFCFEAGLHRPLLCQKSSKRENFLEEVFFSEDALKGKEPSETIETTQLTTTKITSTSKLTTEQETGITETSSLEKISEMSLKSLENPSGTERIKGRLSRERVSISKKRDGDEKDLIKTKISEVDENTSEKTLKSSSLHDEKTPKKETDYKFKKLEIFNQEEHKILPRSSNKPKMISDDLKLTIEYQISSPRSKKLSKALEPTVKYEISSNELRRLANNSQPGRRFQLSSNKFKQSPNDSKVTMKSQQSSGKSKIISKELQITSMYQISSDEHEKISSDLQLTKKYQRSSNEPKGLSNISQPSRIPTRISNKPQESHRPPLPMTMRHQTSDESKQLPQALEPTRKQQEFGEQSEPNQVLQSIKHRRQFSIDSKDGPLRFFETKETLMPKALSSYMIVEETSKESEDLLSSRENSSEKSVTFTDEREQ